jgi:hypothetical protein
MRWLSAISAIWPELHAWAVNNMIPLEQTWVDGVPYQAFVRPSGRILDVSGDNWVTSAGIILEITPASLAMRPRVEIDADISMQWLGGAPNARAELIDRSEPSASPIDLPASATATGSRYQVVIDCSQRCAVLKQPEIHVSFDRFFVPRKLGINNDERELVVSHPTLNLMPAQ